jgi:uncharacterized protein YbjT (DUF2867 family)
LKPLAARHAEDTHPNVDPKRKAYEMKIVIIGGTGLIGSQVVQNLRARGHEAIPASPNSGVNTITGEGLDTALAGAQVVVDLANGPDFSDAAILEFFQTSGRNLLKAEVAAGVGHHVALTIVGADRVPDSGYMRAKLAQEELVEGAGQPYTIVRSTQFFEFMRAAADAGTEGDTVRVPAAEIQPIAAKDVAAAVTDVAVSDPVNGMIEIAGPERIKFPELIRTLLAADNDPRKVVGDEHARYFGTELTDSSITADPGAHLATTTFAEWLAVNRK